MIQTDPSWQTYFGLIFICSFFGFYWSGLSEISGPEPSPRPQRPAFLLQSSFPAPVLFLSLVSPVTLPPLRSVPLSLSLVATSDGWAVAAALRQAAQVSIFRTFAAGDEHPPGSPTPTLPFLLCETRAPKLFVFGSDLI